MPESRLLEAQRLVYEDLQHGSLMLAHDSLMQGCDIVGLLQTL